jgi:hypothetical protein
MIPHLRNGLGCTRGGGFFRMFCLEAILQMCFVGRGFSRDNKTPEKLGLSP